MFFGQVEVDTGETLNIMHPNGQTGGKAILGFWMQLKNYCDGIDTHDLQWFAQAELQAQVALCSLCQPFVNAVVGEWDYEADEYDVYLKRSGEPKLSPEEFLNAVDFHNHTWIDIESLQKCVSHIVQLLKLGSIYGESMLDTQNTLIDFEGLDYTLTLLAQRGATEARIKIF